MDIKNRPPVYYSEYLQLDKILDAQAPESAKEGIRADDEMLFIIIHQAYELWFKQILHELNIVRNIFKQKEVPNNSPDIFNALNRLQRISGIIQLSVSQMTIMETMTPLDFLDFRDLLRPASGFQSIQFKMIEASLGLTFESRFGKGYYLSQLNEKDVERVKKAEREESLLVLINRWLERMPFLEDRNLWNDNFEENYFFKIYREAYADTLLEAELTNLNSFDALLMNKEYDTQRSFSQKANRNALFIMLYRDYPLLQLPYKIVSILLELDEQLSMWRHRHVHMVQRTIGKRVGTGGSSGAEYLKSAADSHIIFKELAELTSFLLPKARLPKLPEQLIRSLSYHH